MLRWWGIRHLRAVFYIIRYAMYWNRVGRFVSSKPNPKVFKRFEDMWDGKCD